MLLSDEFTAPRTQNSEYMDRKACSVANTYNIQTRCLFMVSYYV